MRFLAFFAATFLFAAVTGSRAQQAPSPSSGSTTAPAGDSEPGEPKPAAMTNEQRAEMRAEILIARKEFADAARTLEDLLKDEPKNAGVLNRTGICYQQLGDLTLAERYYKRAVKSDKTNGSAVNNLGTLEFSRRHYGKAIKYYRKALTLGDDHAPIYSNLGYAFSSNKEYPEAIDAFSKALALDPEVFQHKNGSGTLIQQRTATEPGMLNFLLAKSFARAGDAERTARYLKVARDDGYKDLALVKKDPDFARVIKDPRVLEVLQAQPAYAGDETSKPASN